MPSYSTSLLCRVCLYVPSALLQAHPDKLVVMKITASYCRACAALDPKFTKVMRDEKLSRLPIVWADFKASPANKAYFRRLGVLSLPTIQFYDGTINGLVENFPCGPSQIPTLLQKLSQFLNLRVDPVTLQLKKPECAQQQQQQLQYSGAGVPRRIRDIKIGDELVTQEHWHYLRDGTAFFQDLTDHEFEVMLSKASLQTFLPGDVVIKQGMPGKSFFVVKSGLLEMSIKSYYADPISTPPTYLGAVVNQLTKFDYFGERALTTGQPYAASVRALEKSRCFVFNVDIIPESSILSKKRRATKAMVDHLSERYQLPENYEPTYFASEKDEMILELLLRFKQIRQVAKCFEYVMSKKPMLGDKGEIARRSMLVSKLSQRQRQDFVEIFNMIDVYRKGTISLLDMRRIMESARSRRTDDELLEMIAKANPLYEGHKFGIGITVRDCSSGERFVLSACVCS